MDWTVGSVAHIFGWMKHSQPDWLNWLQPPQDTPSKYLQNAPKSIENDQDLNTLTNSYKILLVNTFKMHLKTLKMIMI